MRNWQNCCVVKFDFKNAMDEKHYIVGIGEILWDVFPTGKRLGGAPANFAYHATQAGLDGIAVSAVGNDALGQEAEAALAAKRLATRLEHVPFPTGTVRVSLDDAGVATYEFAPDAAWDNLEYTPALDAIARAARAVCFGTLAQRAAKSRATVRRFVEAVDGMRVFDINLRGNFYDRDTIEESLQICNILKINDDEIRIIARMFDLPDSEPDICCRKLISHFGLDMVVLTCGADGSHVYTRQGATSHLPTPHVKVADTVGAGDSFTAAFVSALVKGEDLDTAHRKATEVAAYVCTCEGAMPPYDSRKA